VTIPNIVDIDFSELLALEPHGPDTFVGMAAQYPWTGRLFGGQVVAQALKAAAETVDAARSAHSLHSYFIRPGSHDEPLRFEVERLRDGRSFSTRQVVVRQSSGAILNLSVSFQVAEDEADVQVAELPADIADPDDPALTDSSWGGVLERRAVETDDGSVGHWIRLRSEIGDDPIDHACGLAFISDAAPSRSARSPHPDYSGAPADRRRFQGASLDHSIWFHRPSDPTIWHWFDTRSHGLAGGRGLVTGDVIERGGVQVATIAQQVLLRRRLDRA
jgi:acyl-CoA thioesterase-2